MDPLDLGDAATLLEEEAEDLYEEAPCGYLSTLPDGTILKVNRTFERWTGRRREELVGRTRFQDLLAAGGRIYHETHYRPLLQMQGTVREIALEVMRADGSLLPVLVNSVLRRDGAGRPRIVRTTVFDATDRRAYERELLHARRRAETLQRRSALIAEVARVIVLSRDAERRASDLLGLLVSELAEGAVMLLAGRETPVAQAGAGEPGLAAAAEGALRDGAPVLERDDAGAITGAALPLSVDGAPIGAIGVTLSPERHGFGEEVVGLLEEIADRAAVAIDNAMLYQRERTVALTLQRAMLAGDLPEDPRYALGSHYAVAVETLEVGGDWYDAFRVGPDRLVAVVGDVVGKGLEAAATMGQLRSALRAVSTSGLGPAAVLEQLDRFADHTPLALGATLAVLELDLPTGTVRLAVAGHPPPVLLAPGSVPELIWEGRSPPVGATFTAMARAEATLRLEPGTRVLLYTDGLVESRDRAIDVGIDRLAKAFGRRVDDPVATVGAALADELLPERHGADDVCTLVICFDG